MELAHLYLPSPEGGGSVGDQPVAFATPRLLKRPVSSLTRRVPIAVSLWPACFRDCPNSKRAGIVLLVFGLRYSALPATDKKELFPNGNRTLYP